MLIIIDINGELYINKERTCVYPIHAFAKSTEGWVWIPKVCAHVSSKLWDNNSLS